MHLREGREIENLFGVAYGQNCKVCEMKMMKETKKLKQNFACSYLRIDWHDFLKVESPTSVANVSMMFNMPQTTI